MYAITTPQGDTIEEQDFSTAREAAQRVAKELTVELEVIHVPTGAVAFVATYVEGRQFHPWERVETPAHQAPHFAGWRPAYQRKRIQATVYRSYDEDNELPWRVLDGRTGNHRDVANTKAACQLTKDMRGGLTL